MDAAKFFSRELVDAQLQSHKQQYSLRQLRNIYRPKYPHNVKLLGIARADVG